MLENEIILLAIAGVFSTLIGFIGIMFIFWASGKTKRRNDTFIDPNERGVKFILYSLKFLVGSAIIIIGGTIVLAAGSILEHPNIFYKTFIFLIGFLTVAWMVVLSLFFLGIYENYVIKPQKEIRDRHKRLNPP